MAAKYATRPGKQLLVIQYLIRVLTDVGEDFYIIMRYIIETYNSYSEPIVRKIIRAVRPKEENAMMSQFAQDIIAKGKPEWEMKGLQDGIQIGKQEGETKLLTRQLQRRFGELPVWASEKIAKAEPPALEEWSLRILDATTLESVLVDLS